MLRGAIFVACVVSVSGLFACIGLDPTAVETFFEGPLIEEFSLQGSVFNAANGNALAGAVVEVANGRFVGRRDVTDRQGRYEIPNLVGAMTVKASMQGFRSQSKIINLTPCRDAEAGCSPTVRLDFQLRRSS